ncbi:MAG TPA: helix-turn-helix transcriptional regulator [Polyangiaceae bacterium]
MYESVVLRLAKRVQQLRKNLGMTQATLASRAGVTVETVARLERVVRGRLSANSNPSLETLARLAVALEVELHELLAPEPVAQRKQHQLGYLLEGASPVVTQRILRVAEVLLHEDQAEVRHSTIRDLGHKGRPGTGTGAGNT